MRNASLRAVSSRCSYLIILGALSAKQRVANPSVKAVALRCLISWLHDLSLSKTVSSRLGHVCSKQAVHVQVLYTVSQCSEPLCGVIHSDFGAGTVYLKHRHAGPVRCLKKEMVYVSFLD
jgi:hypothetical protein